MKKLNELQSYLTRLRGLMLTLIILCSIGSGNAWGAATLTGNVVYSCSPTSIANTTTHQYWSSKSVARNNASDLTASAYWEMNIGSSAGLGSNNNQKAKMILSNGSMTGGSAIASAIGKTTSATYVAAFVCNTALANVGKFAFSHDGYNNNAPANMWLCYSTDNWSTATAIALTVGTSGNVTFDATIPSAKYAFVIYKSSYTRVSNPTFTFYEGTTGGGCSDPATALSVSAASTTIYAGVKSQLSTSGGNGSTVTYTVTSANSAYATIDGDKKFSASRPGTYTVQASQDASGGTCGGTSTVDITVRYQIKWSVNGDDTYDTGSPTTYIEEYNGKIGTFPTSPAKSACDGSKEFVGWTATPIVGTTNTKPTFVTPQTQITDNTTLYAVFATRTANSYSPGDINDLINGKNVIIYNANQSKAMASSIQATGKLNGLAVTFSSTNISSPDAALIWTVYNSGTKYIFKSGNNYLRVTSNSANTKLTCDGTSDTWTITEVSTGVYSLYSTAGSSTYPLEAYYSSPNYFFTSYKGSGANYNMTFYVPTYTAYVTTCCTPLGTINGSISVNNPTSVTLTWSAVTGAEKYQVKVPGSSSHDTWTDVNSTSVTVTKSCGTAYTAYFRAIDTNSSHCSTGPESTLAIPAVSYTVTSTGVTNVTPATAFPSTTCTGFSIASMTPADGYTLPSTITVVNADHIWNSSTGALTISNVTGNVTITITGQVAANFTNGETVFIQADSKDYSAWKDDACVKAYFNTSGSGGSAVTTYWLFDATDDDAGKKLFAAVVPSAGLNQVQLQRFASNCSDWWNANGTVTKASSSGVNTFRSYGSADNNVAWNGSSTTLSLYGSQNSWGSSLGTFADQGSGVWTATISNYTPDATSKDYKIKTSYNNGWIGNTGSNNNATLSDMIVGSTYNVTATLNVTDHSLVMSKTFVKGTVHFDMQGHGSAISDLTNVTAGSKISAPSTPSATGYDFGGWYKEAGCSNAWDFANDVVNETMTLYAKWTKHSYTISSTLNHCSSSPSIPSSYEYTGSAAGLTYTISADAGYRLPTSITVSGTTYTWNSATGALTLTGTITSNVSITITAVQTHTVTWLSNGSNYVSPVTYDHGATLAFPAGEPSAPSSCSEKVFVGWTSDSEITSETSTEPTLISEGGAVNEDATYRAVFADEEGGGTTTILNEPFTGFSEYATPTSPGSSATTLDGSSIAYTCTAGGSGAGNTNIQTSGGPDAGNNLLIRKKNGAFTINSIPANSQTSATLTYKWRGTGTLVLSGSSNISLGSISTETDGSSNNTCTVTITINSGTTYSLTWTNTHTDNNLRFDSPTITCSGVSYDNYITQCCALKPVTNLAVSSSTANSVTLSWTAPSPTTGIDHLELRNASTDAKIGSNIAVGTTTTSVSGLVECNTYSYKVVSVGATCETSSEVIEAQPFSGAKTVTFNYNGGSGSPASFTTSCSGNTVTLPTPDTRAGYTFDGWWTAEFGGVKKGDAGASYTVSGTTTLWAHWSQTNYTVTMQQSPAAGATLSGGTTTAHYGNTINISTDVPSGYRFTGWTSSPSVTFVNASATSTSFTMPASNVTVTANFVQVHTLTFITPSGGGSAVTPPATADHGGTVTLPSTSGKLPEYSCETFLGWTTTAPNGSGTWASTPSYKAAGATSDVINTNTTFYAVYSRSGGGASGDVELTCTDVSTWKSSILGGVTNSYGTSTTRTATDGSSWTTTGQIADAGDINIKDGYYIKLPTVAGTISSIEMVVSQSNESDACAEYPGSLTTKIVYFRSSADGSNLFSSESTSSRSRTITITSGDYYTGYLCCTDGTINFHAITVHYGPAPVISHTLKCGCLVEEFNMTYDANTANFPGSVISCSNVTGWNFEDDGNYTFCSGITPPSGYKFKYWSMNANGSGDNHWDAGEEVSCVPDDDFTAYAIYERVYTVTFNNQGATTPVTQASEGATIAVPSATSPCSAEWAFVGWSETAIAPMSMLPALEITAGTSTYTPTDDKTLYAIYRKTSTSSAFVAGMSGAYKISNGSTVYAGACNNSKLPETNAAGAYVFYIKYTSADGGKYTIQQADGKYLKYGGSSTSLALDDETPYYWTMTKNGDLWHVLGVGSGRYLQHSSGTGFKAYDGNTTTDIAFVAADGQYYYRTMSCAADYDITFHANGTTITWAVGHPEASYKDLANATVVSTFPTATYDGWTFLGWRRSDYAESTTVPEASGIFGGSDGTSGNTLTIASADEDLYPVFTKFEDNAPFDQINGGDYYIYFLESGSDDGYGGEKRVYATDYDDLKRYSSTALCAEATEFTFTKLANGNWTIYDKAKSKYLYAEGDDWLKQKTTTSGAEWTLTVNGNAFDAYCVGTSFGQISAYGNGTSALFMNYARTNIGSQPNYHRVYLGGCSNRTFTTNPSNTPEIVINGKVKVTSAASQAVKSTTTLSVSAINISTANLTVTSDNSAFTFSLTQNGSYTSSVNIPVVSNKVSVTPIYVAYTPSATTDGIENATVTVSDGAGTPTSVSTESGDVQGRHLPAQFVIAAKAGSEWVALTAKISKMGTQDAIPIQVDNTTTPTKASVAMNTSEYSLLGLPSTNSRYATNGIAVHLYSNQTSKVLNATKSTSIKTAINTGANASNAASSDSCLFYEWKLFSEDLVHYTVTNSNTLGGLSNNRVLGYSTGAGKWGMYTAANANQDIFLLPIETLLTDLDVEVMEWSTTGMALRFNGTAPSSIKVTLGGATSAAKSLTNLNSSDIYTVSGLSLSTNNCAVMQITDGSDASKGTLVRKPILVSGDSLSSRQRTYLTDDVCASCDIVILNNGKLTADQAKTNHTKFANIYVYPGGKLVVDAGSGTSGSLGANQKVYVRGGYSWLNPTTYKLPELYIQGNINFEGSGSIIYDYYIQPYKYYQCALPYNSELAKITDEAGVDDFPSWLKHYDGSLRAANAQATSWDWYNGDEVDEKTVIPAGKGFIIAARPRQVAKVMNRPLAIIRFPLINNAFNGSGEAEKTVSTTAHGIAGYNAGTVTANNVGWNLIGNPYMATWKGNIGHSQLEKHPDAAHWDGSYYWKDGDTKYVTVMSAENGSSYEQYVASTTELKPFFPFFIQETASGGTGTVTFTLGNRVKKAPAYLRAESENREAFVQIDMTNGENQDQTGIYVGNKYSDDLDFDDLEKMFGSQTTTPRVWIMHESTRMAFEAMSEERAAGAVPMGYRAPETGEYTFTLSDYSNLENVEAVLLDDNEAGVYNYNLLTSDYTFSSESALYNDTRFVIRIEMKNENQGTTTGTENIDLRSEEPFKFIYHDKMYILRNGVIYDATGKKVREIK